MTKNGIIALIVIFLAVAGITFIVSKQKISKETATQTERAVDESNEMTSTTPAPTTSVVDSPQDPQETIKAVSEITLTISSPVSGSSVTTAKATVKGKTSPKAEVLANEAEGIADSSGNFSLSVILDEGENSIIVTAVDENGKVAEKEILVTYDVGE